MDAPNTSSTPANSAPSGDLYAALAYLPPLLFILTMIKKGDSPSHVWHAKNGAGVFVLAIAVNIVEQILVRTIGLYFLVPLLSLALLLLMLFAAWQAWNGKQWNIPFVTDFGQKIPLEKWFHKGVVDSTTSPSSAATPTTPVSAPAPVEAAPATPATPVSAPAPVEAAPAAPATPVSAPAPVEAAPAAPAPESPMTPNVSAEKPAEGSTPTTPTV